MLGVRNLVRMSASVSAFLSMGRAPAWSSCGVCRPVRSSLGLPAAALAQVIAHVQSKKAFSTLAVSYVPGAGCPEAFYLKAGFRHTGKLDDGEIILELPLR